MSNLVVVAIPDENDRVWKVSSDPIPHLTILYLGDSGQVSNLENITKFVEHAADTSLRRFYLPVDRRDALGADEADVLFFKRGRYDFKAVRDFRVQLLQDSNIRKAYDASTQFDGPWVPHLTLGYPAQPAKPDKDDYSFYDVQFNKIAVWTDNYDGPEFLLKDPWEEWDTLEASPMALAMSDIRGMSAEELEHHGVKGMRWGVTRENTGSAARSVGSAATSAGGKVGRAASATTRFVKDVNFENKVESGAAREEVMFAAQKDFRKIDLKSINAKPEHIKASKLRNRLRNPRDPGTKAYRKEVKEAYIKRLETTANSMKNASGDRQYTIRERGIELPAEGGALPKSKYQWEVSSRKVTHAAVEPDFTLLDVIMDDDGFITDIQQADAVDSIAQSLEDGAEFLVHTGLMTPEMFLEEYGIVHYGVKGMRWGSHRTRDIPAAVTPTTTTKIPSGNRRKTQIKVEGGQNHDAHPDAIKVAESRAKLKKSGPVALSNQELRDVANRLQLEGQVKQLTSSSGQKFVSNLLKNEGNQSAGRVLRKKAMAKGF